MGRSPVLLPGKLTQCSGLCLMGRRQLQGFSGILSGGPGPEPEGSVSLTEPATRFTREGGGRACGCPFTANWKDWVLSEMLSGDMIEASKIMQTLNDMDRLVHRSRYTRIGKRV